MPTSFRFATLAALFALTAAALSAATTVIRGPYLQSATPTSLVVRWRTDNTEASIVRYGLTRTELTSTAKAEGINSEHVVFLSKLKPNTRYYYSLGAEPAPKPATTTTEATPAATKKAATKAATTAAKAAEPAEDAPGRAPTYSFVTPPET
eukprot:gene7358-9814_t